MKKYILLLPFIFCGCETTEQPQKTGPQLLKINNSSKSKKNRNHNSIIKYYNVPSDEFHREYYRKNKISPH